MSYKYKAATKKDEQDLKEYTAAVEEQKEEKTEAVKSGGDNKALTKELEKRGIPFITFSLSDEGHRKRLLKDDYQSLKDKYGWQYDQPIQ